MAGPAHDVLVQALRDDATLLPAILARLRRRRLPRLTKPVDSAVRLARPVEVRPDIVYRTAGGWAVCEVQNKIDRKKRRRWPLTASVLLDQTRRMGDVVVITASASVARWARKAAHLRGPAGTLLQLTPVVVYLSLRCARALLDPKTPQLALCAAWAMQHRHGPAAASIVERAIAVTSNLPPPLRTAQWRAILDVLSDKMLSRLREAAMHPDRVPERPATRKLRLFLESIGEKRGRAEGKAEGRAEGKAEGRAEGKREDLLTVLSERGLSLTEEQRARIEKCTDVEQLGLWLRRAITAASVADVLTAAAKAKKPAPTRRRTRPSAKAGASR
jgi:hypothetical protein